MNDDVTLSMENEEFNDWHISVPFPLGNVKVLCCPEDIECCSRDNHGHNICCEGCKAPICEECSESIFAREPSMPSASLSNDMMI